MKTIKNIFIFAIMFFMVESTFSQSITADTTLANEYYTIAENYFYASQNDSALFFIEKAQPLYLKHLGEKSLKNANCLELKGIVYYFSLKPNEALEALLQEFEIKRELLGEKNMEIASCYNKLGILYNEKSDYEKALENHEKCLNLKLELLGNDNIEVANSYNNIGIVYVDKAEFEKALEYYEKCLVIQLNILDEKHRDIADTYNNIGIVYWNLREYDHALEYQNKSLQMNLELIGENNTYVADNYSNIGNIYWNRQKYDLALENHFKSLKIHLELHGANNIKIVKNYNNIGVVYNDMSEYGKAIEYFQKALDILIEIYGEKHFASAMIYNNLGLNNHKQKEYDRALEFYFKSLEIRVEQLTEKHLDVATTYLYLGDVFSDKKQYQTALMYYQKGVASSLFNFNDTTNIFSVPQINNYVTSNWLLKNLHAKAQLIADTTKILSGYTNPQRLQIALRHYQAADSLIQLSRQEVTSIADKIAIGEIACKVYEQAVDVALLLNNKELAFYFSEKNKAAVLLEALAGQEAQKFADIPDSLLQKEKELKKDITFLNLQLATPARLDSAKIAEYKNLLFDLNRAYENLIHKFELQFPEYFSIKYFSRTASIADIQEILDKKTALISYFVGDSTITIFTISKKNIDIQQIETPQNFADSIKFFRYSLSFPKNALFFQQFKSSAFILYEMLFPKNLAPEIVNLIIIPDNYLSSIPFETLLYQRVSQETPFEDLPYLVQKYNISYSYSATLFHKTYPKQNSNNVEVTQLEDWLAFAPVANENSIGMSLTSRILGSENIVSTEDTLQTRFLHENFSALPGTLSEVTNILQFYVSENLSAQIHVNQNANETLIKSGILERYRIVHFATHGLVNSQKPDLSCILLAKEDSASVEDGILFSSEIYNMKINADLVVLSACETGLGEIKKGEGIIGLTRALLYAGTRNIVVSLWKVSDYSTAQLMIDFYQNILHQDDQNPNYARCLRNAKLNMINNSEFAHPFYWSPFILVGK